MFDEEIKHDYFSVEQGATKKENLARTVRITVGKYIDRIINQEKMKMTPQQIEKDISIKRLLEIQKEEKQITTDSIVDKTIVKYIDNWSKKAEIDLNARRVGKESTVFSFEKERLNLVKDVVKSKKSIHLTQNEDNIEQKKYKQFVNKMRNSRIVFPRHFDYGGYFTGLDKYDIKEYRIKTSLIEGLEKGQQNVQITDKVSNRPSLLKRVLSMRKSHIMKVRIVLERMA